MLIQIKFIAHTAPFKMHVHFDDGELVANGGTDATCETCAPADPNIAGVTAADGFYLEYFQLTC